MAAEKRKEWRSPTGGERKPAAERGRDREKKPATPDAPKTPEAAPAPTPPASGASIDAVRAKAISRYGTAGQSARLEMPSTAMGAPVRLSVATVDGRIVPIQEILPEAREVKLKVGERLEVDPVTFEVSVPPEMNLRDPEALPLIVREIARASHRGAVVEVTDKGEIDYNSMKRRDIDRELQTRAALEKGTEELAERFSSTDFASMRRRYKALESSHAQTVARAESAVDSFMQNASEAYRKLTGADLHQNTDYVAMRDRVRAQLLDTHDGLIYRYDEKGKSLVFGEAGVEGVGSEGRSVLDRLGALWSQSSTVQDYRLRRHLRDVLTEKQTGTKRVASRVADTLNHPWDVTATFGKTGVIILGGIALKIFVEPPMKVVTWGLDKVDGFLYKLQTKFGVMMSGDKAFKPKRKPSGTERDERDASIEKTAKKLQGLS